MKLSFAWIAATGLTIAAGAALGQVPPAQPPADPAPQAQPAAVEDADASKELAERFCETGLKLARSTKYSALGLHQSAALLEAATLLNPTEPRFLRLLAFWRTQSGDVKGAIAAWNKYRAIPLVRDDCVAQSALIDLYLSQLESNDAKIKYIREGMLPKPSLDNTVKAHIAAEAVSLLNERSPTEARAMLVQARQFYPLPEVTLLEWQMLPADATPVQRLAAMLNVLRANPANVDALSGVADLLSANGVSDKALKWHQMLKDVREINESPANESSVLNFIAEQYRSGQSADASKKLDKILQNYPDDQHAWFLKLTMERSPESATLLQQAREMFAHRLDDLCDRIKKAPVGGETAPSPTTHPTNAPAQPQTPMPEQSQLNVSAAITRVKELDPKVESVLVDTLAEQAWFEIYYDHKADAALSAINSLKQLVPPDSVAMRRLQGWFSLAKGDEAGARALLTPQKEKDALSALGLYELENQKNHPAEAAALAGKLLAFPQTGELAAVIFQATKAHGIKTAPATPDAAAMKTELDKFPFDWLEINRNPFRFYSIRADAIVPGHQLGDAMLGEVTLTNNSQMDITIGQRGLIKPVYAFDAKCTGIQADLYDGVLVDRIMGRLVLRPGDSISQIVRIDQGDLNHALYTLPAVRMLVDCAVLTNSPPDNPGSRPMAGGYPKKFERQFSRNPVALGLAPARQNIFGQMVSGPARQKILDLDLTAVYYTQYVQPKATNTELAAAADFLNAIDKSRSDTDPSVKAWANYTYSHLSSGVEQTQVIVEMLEATDWPSRLLGLAAAQKSLPKDMARQLATKAASSDAEALVKGYAAGVVEMLNQEPATQPASIKPETQPTK